MKYIITAVIAFIVGGIVMYCICVQYLSTQVTEVKEVSIFAEEKRCKDMDGRFIYYSDMYGNYEKPRCISNQRDLFAN